MAGNQGALPVIKESTSLIQVNSGSSAGSTARPRGHYADMWGTSVYPLWGTWRAVWMVPILILMNLEKRKCVCTSLHLAAENHWEIPLWCSMVHGHTLCQPCLNGFPWLAAGYETKFGSQHGSTGDGFNGWRVVSLCNEGGANLVISCDQCIFQARSHFWSWEKNPTTTKKAADLLHGEHQNKASKKLQYSTVVFDLQVLIPHMLDTCVVLLLPEASQAWWST